MSRQTVKLFKQFRTHTIVSAAPGDTLFVTGKVTENAAEFAYGEPLETGGYKVTFTSTCLVSVQGLTQNHLTVKNLRYIRKWNGELLGACGDEIEYWRRMQEILKVEQRELIHVTGGFAYVIVYKGERAIPNYSDTGSSGWILTMKEIDELIAKHPLPPDKVARMAVRFDQINSQPRNRQWKTRQEANKLDRSLRRQGIEIR